MEGYLNKKAMSSFGKDSWKKRFFRLRGTDLSYFENEKAGKSKGSLFLEKGSRIVLHASGPHKGKTNELEVTFPSKNETLYATAEDVSQL